MAHEDLLKKYSERIDNFPEIFTEENFENKITEAENFLSQFGGRFYFDANDGRQISYMKYLYPDSEKTIVISIGFTEFAEKYTEIAYYFVKMGFNVYILEHRGHGYSYKPFENDFVTHIDNFQTYVDDFTYFVTDIVSKISGGKIFVLSHSMGACIAGLSLLSRNMQQLVSKVVFSSPMLSFSPKGITDGMLLHFVKKNIKINGAESNFKYSKPFTPNVNFHLAGDTSFVRFNHNLNKRIENDKYKGSLYTNGWVIQSIMATHKLTKHAKEIKIPALVLTGNQDIVIKRRSQIKFEKHLSDSEYICLSGVRHSIFTSECNKLSEALTIVVNFFR